MAGTAGIANGDVPSHRIVSQSSTKEPSNRGPASPSRSTSALEKRPAGPVIARDRTSQQTFSDQLFSANSKHFV
jgi:hypothetical protein